MRPPYTIEIVRLLPPDEYTGAAPNRHCTHGTHGACRSPAEFAINGRSGRMRKRLCLRHAERFATRHGMELPEEPGEATREERAT